MDSSPIAVSSLLWEITGDAGVSSYLFGTIHVYDPSLFCIPRQAFDAIASCHVFAMEFDGSHLSYTDMMNRMTSSDPESTLDKLLSPATYARLMALPTVSGREHIVNRYKPFFITSLILSDYSEERISSVDEQLLTYAKAEMKEIVSLETFDSQVDVVDGIPLEEQVRMVEEALLQETPTRDALQKMMFFYRDQDFASMAQSMQVMSPSPLFVEVIQHTRNVNMARRMDLLMQPDKQSVFVAVGALHLPDVNGVEGMLSLLRKMNYTLRAVPVSFVV